jgi:hypothetical protein
MKMNKKGFGLRPFVINLILLVLFSFFIIAFALGFISQTNPSSDVLTFHGGILNNSYNSLNNQLNVFSTQTCTNASGGNCTDNSLFGKMAKSNPSPVDYLFLIFQGAFEIPKALLSFSFGGLITMENVIFLSLGGSGLGIGVVIGLNIVITILVITLVLLIVSAIRGGSTER